jgi:hypothetical protein
MTGPRRVAVLVVAVVVSGCASARVRTLETDVARLEVALESAIREASQENASRRRLEGVNDRQVTEIERRDRDLEAWEVQLSDLRTQLRAATDRLATADVANVLELQAELEGLRATAAESARAASLQMDGVRSTAQEAERAAALAGMLAVWESITIEATPMYRQGGPPFGLGRENFMRVSVEVRDRRIFQHDILTTRATPGFTQAFSGLADIVGLAASLALMR